MLFILAILIFIIWLIIPSPPKNGQLSSAGITGELPPDHPPIDNNVASNNNTSGAMPPFVMEQLTKLRTAIESNSKEVPARIQLAEMYYQIGQFEQALKYLDEALNIEPQNLDALVMAGNACYEAQLPDRAVSYYSRALTINPNDINVRTDMGTMLLHSGKIDQAINEFNRVLAIKSDFIPAFVNLAEAYKTKGDMQKYFETLQKALDKAHTEAEKKEIRDRMNVAVDG